MTYKIISTRQAGETLITIVEYNFDGTLIQVDIPHFMPQSTEEIEQNIISRAASEIVKINAANTISTLISVLPINEEKPIE